VQGVRGEQQAQRRARVVAAAMSLATDGGYDAVQMRAVSQEADVALGTIYRYFSSKDQLLLAVLDQLAQDMQQEMRDMPPRGESVLDRVTHVLDRCCGLLEDRPLLTHAVVTALSSSDASVADLSDGVYGRLTSLIAEAIGDDAIDAIDEIEGVVHVLGQVWFASMLAWVGGRSKPGTMAMELQLAARLLLGRH
jgi:AcrR family transcriptional regulator